MSMRRIIIKGGYGEHGRSCFLVEYGTAGRYFMVDCGIMDTDENPFPAVTGEELEAVDYLFLTHCHKDHSGAFSYFTERGFSGTLVTSSMTYELAGLNYEKRIFLPIGKRVGMIRLEELTIRYGRSGHCPGGLWFYIEDGRGRMFFSGDYQADSCFYACDRVEQFGAELAVADCAHNKTMLNAEKLRERIVKSVDEKLTEGRRCIFPVPQYGRGLEILYLLKERFPEKKIRIDRRFLTCAERMLKEEIWFRDEPYRRLKDGEFLGSEPVPGLTPGPVPGLMPELVPDSGRNEMEYDILLIADTHLKEQENRELVEREVGQGAVVFVTGRVKPGGLPDRLLKEERALRFSFPHHQSRGDLEKMIQENSFGTVLPFHNEEKEVFVVG